MSEWRLCSDITAFVVSGTGTRSVYLSDSSKKKYLDQTKRNIPTGATFTEESLPNEGFRLKFIGEEFMISHENLGKDWFVVKNVHAPLNTLKVLVPYTSIEHGEFSGDFEMMFSDNFPGVFKPINTDHPGYQEAMEELRRRINCEMCPKTKKWKPGYRYDTMSGTIYYLGQFWSHRVGETGKFEKTAPRVVYFFTPRLQEGEKTISDVLKNRLLHPSEGEVSVRDEEIGVLEKMSPRVEVGQYLEDDLGSGQEFNLWEALIGNYMKTTEIPYSENSRETRYDRSGSLWSIFDYTEETGWPVLDASLTGTISGLAESEMRYQQIEFYGSNYYGTELETSDKKTQEQNISSCVALFLRSIPSQNTLKRIYYPKLMEALGLDLPGIADRVLLGLSQVRSDMTTTIQGALDYEVRLRRIDNSRYHRVWGSEKELTFYPEKLRDVLLEFVDFIIENHGQGVKSYQVSNYGTKARPRDFLTTTITLPELIEHLGGINKIPDDLKVDILESGFFELTIDRDLSLFSKDNG
jgi:hypothetical protein